jgi:uncharacterized protein YueI
MMDESLIVRTRISQNLQLNEVEIANRVSADVLNKLVDYVEQKRYVKLAEATGLNITVLKEVERLLYSDQYLVEQAKCEITARRLKGE